jgi:hypothetical protein
LGGGDASACQTVLVGCVRREVGGEGGRQSERERGRWREGGRGGGRGGGVGRRGACIGGEEGASK